MFIKFPSVLQTLSAHFSVDTISGFALWWNGWLPIKGIVRFEYRTVPEDQDLVLFEWGARGKLVNAGYLHRPPVLILKAHTDRALPGMLKVKGNHLWKRVKLNRKLHSCFRNTNTVFYFQIIFAGWDAGNWTAFTWYVLKHCKCIFLWGFFEMNWSCRFFIVLVSVFLLASPCLFIKCFKGFLSGCVFQSHIGCSL